MTDTAIVIRIPRPALCCPAEGALLDAEAPSRAQRAELLSFAARGDSFQGTILWHRYEAIYSLYLAKTDELNADPDSDPVTRLYDTVTQTAASYAAVAGTGQRGGELFLDRAMGCMERVPRIGRLLREGVLTPGWFLEALHQRALVDATDVLEVVDEEAAVRLRTAGALSRSRVASIVAMVVAKHDADAARQMREAAKPRKQVRVVPQDPGSGLSDLVITADTVDVALSREVLDAVIAGVCPNDPRSRQQRRSDAAMARINGTTFACGCDGELPCTSTLSDAHVAERCAGVVLHVIARDETVHGDAGTPGFLDGFGPMTADLVRDVAGRSNTTARNLDLGKLIDAGPEAAGRYRPSETCDAAVRALHGRCSWPGCSRSAWKSDLDHVCEFDPDDPAGGGPTCHCNLNPKCRFHHGLKTHAAGWLDDQIIDAHGVVWTEVVTPEGLTIRAQASNTWLLPELGSIPCRHGPLIDPGVVAAEAEPRRMLSRTEVKRRYRMALRAANRRRRERDEELAKVDPPPF